MQEKIGYLPNHEFVITRGCIMARVRSSEEIVRHVRPNIVPGVAPRRTALQVRDLAHELRRNRLARVWVSLHIVVSARPVPVGLPGRRAAGARDLETSASRA